MNLQYDERYGHAQSIFLETDDEAAEYVAKYG